MKTITITLPDFYDQVISITAIGVVSSIGRSITNVTVQAYEVEDGKHYIIEVPSKETDICP